MFQGLFTCAFLSGPLSSPVKHVCKRDSLLLQRWQDQWRLTKLECGLLLHEWTGGRQDAFKDAKAPIGAVDVAQLVGCLSSMLKVSVPHELSVAGKPMISALQKVEAGDQKSSVTLVYIVYSSPA